MNNIGEQVIFKDTTNCNGDDYDCKDQKYDPSECKYSDGNHKYFGDKVCDGSLNNEKNCYDGGDCYGEDADFSFCNESEGKCECIDPKHQLPCKTNP